MVDISIVNGVYKPTYNWGAPPCMEDVPLPRFTKGYLVGGFNHLEKYESQWEGLSHILWKKEND